MIEHYYYIQYAYHIYTNQNISKYIMVGIYKK